MLAVDGTRRLKLSRQPLDHGMILRQEGIDHLAERVPITSICHHAFDYTPHNQHHQALLVVKL